MKIEEFFDTIEFSINKGLIGEIIPSLREVSFIWNPNKKIITILFYHDGEITPIIDDHYSLITSEADSCFFGRDVKLDHSVIRCDYPNALPKNDHIVYRRKEPFLRM